MEILPNRRGKPIVVLHGSAAERAALLGITDFDITLTRLLAELRPTWQEHSAADKRTVVQAPVEPLTERELEVLRYIAEGLSNYDIATRMFVGVSTVKTHINHLYSKLDVKSRIQAAARARALNLL